MISPATATPSVDRCWFLETASATGELVVSTVTEVREMRDLCTATDVLPAQLGRRMPLYRHLMRSTIDRSWR